jgi:hypothetical protein
LSLDGKITPSISHHSGDNINARIPPILHPLLQEYTQRVNQQLPGQITAFYLEGSTALGEFNPRLSDVDFIAVLNHNISPDASNQLREIHQDIEKSHSQWKLSGMYFQSENLGRQVPYIGSFLHYHDGKLDWSDQFDLSAVTWWILKKHGISVFGPAPQELPYSVDMDDLIQKQRENLASYWAGWTTRPGRIAALYSDWGIEWAVLGVLRPFYTIRERSITSKIKAGQYALGCLPLRWHRIIREAVRLRKAPAPSHYRTRIGRAIDAWCLLNHVIGAC